MSSNPFGLSDQQHVDAIRDAAIALRNALTQAKQAGLDVRVEMVGGAGDILPGKINASQDAGVRANRPLMPRNGGRA